MHRVMHVCKDASTEKGIFVKKCYILLEAFQYKKVSINLKIFDYLITNPKLLVIAQVLNGTLDG